MIYIADFEFKHHISDIIDPLQSEITSITSRLDGETDTPVTEDQRPRVERRLANLKARHITLQIRDAYLQVISRANGWVNPWAEPAFTGFEDVTDEMLLDFLKTHHANNKAKRDAKRGVLVARRRAAKAAEQWHRPETLTDRYQAVNGRLHEVRVQTRLDGEIVRDVSPHPVNSTRIKYRGEMLSVATVLRILTGSAAKRGRPSKGARYRAQVRQGSRVLHLGVFDSPEERDAAVLNHRLGLGVNPTP